MLGAALTVLLSASVSYRFRMTDSPPFLNLPKLDRPAVVLGSGPNARPPDGVEDWALLTVNGSQSLAAGWAKSDPDMTLFGTTVLGMRPSNREAQAVLRGRHTRLLVMVRDGSNPLLHSFNLWRIGYRYDRRVLLTTAQRAEIFESVLGKALGSVAKPSNGIFLVLIALHLGAPKVLMTGFSLSKAGHGYNEANHPRNHAGADASILAELARREAPVFANDAEFANESGLRLLPD